MKQLKIKYIPTKTGDETIEIEGHLIHSKYDPFKEAQRIIEKNYKESYVNVIFGFGRGFLVEALAQRNINRSKVLFIEPLEQFKNFNDNRYDVYFGTDLEEIEMEIGKKLRYYSRKINIICLANYNKIFASIFRDLLKRVKDIQNFNVIYDNTIRWKSEAWQENHIKNTLYASIDESIIALEKKYDCPIIIASAGPSLTKQLSLLKEVLPNILLIASGSTVTTLLANNIEPDYIVSIEGAYSNFEKHFKNLKLTKAQLLYSCNSSFEIQKNYPNKRFSFLDEREEKLQNYMKQRFNVDVPIVIGGGSVANFALSIARNLTDSPIALIGQDLAYTDGKTHAEGNENNTTVNEALLKRNDAFVVEGYYGDDVMTDYAFTTMKESFEKIVENIDLKETIFNCTEGGAKIKGMQQISFNQFCNIYIDRNKTITLVDTESIRKVDREIYIRSVNKDIQIYKNIIDELKKAQRALKNNKLKTEFSQSTLKILDRVDKKVEKMRANVVMNKIIDPITLDIMTFFEAQGEETKEEKYLRIYKQNEELYRRLIEATEKTMLFAEEAIEDAEKLIGV